MLGFFKKEKDENEKILAPISGRVLASSEIPDPTFSEEMLGKGMAIEPSEGKVYAPVDGELTFVFDTKHALTITSSLGTEILIHIGIDTVSLKGAPFNVLVEGGTQIKKGDLLMEFDMEAIKAAGLSIVTPIIICNTQDYKDVVRLKVEDVAVGDAIMEIVR